MLALFTPYSHQQWIINIYRFTELQSAISHLSHITSAAGFSLPQLLWCQNENLFTLL